METLYNAKLFINNPYSHSPKYLLTLSSTFKIIVNSSKCFTCNTVRKKLLGMVPKPIFNIMNKRISAESHCNLILQKQHIIYESFSICFRTDDDLRRCPLFLRPFSGENFRSKNRGSSRPSHENHWLCLDVSWSNNYLSREVFF